MENKMITEKVAEYRAELGMIAPEIWDSFAECEAGGVKVSVVATRVMNAAASQSVSAGMSGERHDGGSGATFHALKCWLRGLQQKIPDDRLYTDIVKQILRGDNPVEYEEYKRLKAKYGD